MIILLLPPTTYESSKTKKQKKMDLLYIKNKENVYIKMEFCVVFIFWREIAVRAVSPARVRASPTVGPSMSRARLDP